MDDLAAHDRQDRQDMSNAARSLPAKIAILPVEARWQAPETGLSSAIAPLASTIAPRRMTSDSSVVNISSQILPSESPSSTPPGFP